MSGEHVTLIATVFGFLLVSLVRVLFIRYLSPRTRSVMGHQRAERREREWYPSQ
jgi:hypothetical protein